MLKNKRRFNTNDTLSLFEDKLHRVEASGSRRRNALVELSDKLPSFDAVLSDSRAAKVLEKRKPFADVTNGDGRKKKRVRLPPFLRSRKSKRPKSPPVKRRSDKGATAKKEEQAEVTDDEDIVTTKVIQEKEPDDDQGICVDVQLQPPPGVHIYDCSNYVVQVLRHLKDRERDLAVKPDFLKCCVDITERTRQVVVDWMHAVIRSEKMQRQSFHIAVNIMDRTLSVFPTDLALIQLVSSTSILLAAKLNERYVPSVKRLIRYTDDAYTKEQIYDMEKLIVRKLNFDLWPPTPYCFTSAWYQTTETPSKNQQFLTAYLLDICVLCERGASLKPSLAAAAAVCLSNRILGSGIWTTAWEKWTGYTEEELLDAMKIMAAVFQRQLTSECTNIQYFYKKPIAYSVSCDVEIVQNVTWKMLAEGVRLRLI
ncbi:unnamed protein product [Dimorphilus gyrociliatus]|uniref:Uncharacterized protein n=1 Tax=Dimorphilus gyrociliatus TaxID=2664684 RepID=A0A7I8VYB1_9ANNE|nr:unnamed protein product [Dimorphilus gyrociliatus]